MPNIVASQPLATMILLLLLTMLATGCDEKELRKAQLREAIQRQQQLSQQAVDTAHHLVEKDAESRRELVTLQRELQIERVEVGRQRDALETERKQIAHHRLRDPVIATAIGSSLLIVVCALPLVLCWYLLAGLRREDDSGALEDMLIAEVAQDVIQPGSSLLLPGTGAHAPKLPVVPQNDGGDRLAVRDAA